MVLQFILEGPRPYTILCFNVHTTAEYLNKNVSIVQTHFKIYCRLCSVKAKNVNKNKTKKFARLHNHCLLLTMMVVRKIENPLQSWQQPPSPLSEKKKEKTFCFCKFELGESKDKSSQANGVLAEWSLKGYSSVLASVQA